MEQLKTQIEEVIKQLLPKLHEEARLKRKRRMEIYQAEIDTFRNVLKMINNLDK